MKPFDQSPSNTTVTPGISQRSSRRLAKLGLFMGGTTLAILALPGTASAADFSTYMDDTDIKNLTNGLAFYALLACGVGMLISSGMWLLGSQSQNSANQLAGKNGFIVSLAAAFLIGATPSLVTWLQEVSTTGDIDKSGVTALQPFSGGQLDFGDPQLNDNTSGGTLNNNPGSGSGGTINNNPGSGSGGISGDIVGPGGLGGGGTINNNPGNTGDIADAVGSGGLGGSSNGTLNDR